MAVHINDVLRLWSNLDNFTAPSGVGPLLNGIDVLTQAVSVFKKTITYDSEKLGQYRSYSLDIDPLLNLPQQWQRNAIENLEVMVDRFKSKILLVDKVASCSDPQILISLVHGIDLGVPALQEAQKEFLDWMTQTKQRIGDFRTNAL